MVDNTISRRHWLQLAGAQAAGLAFAANAQDTVVLEGDPFHLGIASGHPTHQSVVLWTRLMALNPIRNPWADQTLRVDWEVATDASFTHIVQKGQTFAPPELSHSVHVEVQGLTENQVYWYRFHAYGKTSPTGRTRTFPAAGSPLGSVKAAFACCQRYHAGAFTAYEQMRADQPDVVVFLGDYIYEMGASTSEKRGTWMYPATRYEHYRTLYELARSDVALQKMHADCPWLIIWDDHEVLNDYAGGDVRLRQASGRVARHMSMGYRAWYEHMPVSPRALLGGIPGLLANSNELRIHGSYDWGSLARFHLLDTRQYRSMQAGCGVAGLFDPASCKELPDPQRSMLGEAQEAWLQREFEMQRQQPATRQPVWNLLCQPSVFSPFRIPVLGNVFNHDNWDGYPVARKKIISLLQREQVRNPVIFSGDVHQNWVAHVHEAPDDPQTPVVAPEFCSTSITTPSFGSFTEQDMLRLAPHGVYADRHRRGYALATFSADQLSVELKASDAARAGMAPYLSVARFQVQAGSPRVALK